MDRIEVGYVARAHGVRGELRIQLHDPESTTLLALKRAWFGGVERRIQSIRPTSGAVLLCVDGVNDRNAADAMRSQKVEVLRSDVPLADDEYLIADLPGCEVVDESGVVLGKIVQVLHGAQDILIIHDATHERMLPAVPEFIRGVDILARRVTVAVPEDLPVEPIGNSPAPSGRK